MKLVKGWNYIYINLEKEIKEAYNTEFKEVLTFKIFANCRLRQVFFSERPMLDRDLPQEF